MTDFDTGRGGENDFAPKRRKNVNDQTHTQWSGQRGFIVLRTRWRATDLTELRSRVDPPSTEKQPPARIISQGQILQISQRDILRFLDQFAAFDVEGHNKVRLGDQNDGGYIFIEISPRSPPSSPAGYLTTSAAIWPLRRWQRGPSVRSYGRRAPVEHPKFRFHKQAIDPHRTISGSISLSEVVRIHNAGGEARHEPLLKIDIDGSEWSTFANFPPTICGNLGRSPANFTGCPG